MTDGQDDFSVMESVAMAACVLSAFCILLVCGIALYLLFALS